MSTLTINRANLQAATVTNLNVGSITGAGIATPREIKSGTSITKVVTPYGAKLALTFFTNLGNETTAATFTDITVRELTGDVIADSSTAIAGTSATKLITPSTLAAVLKSPARIGLETPANAIFTTLKMSSVGGSVLATIDEVSTPTLNNKMISPITMYYGLQAPPVIGSSTPNTGTFNNVTADTINMSSDIFQVSEGGFNISTYARGDLLIASDTNVISKLPTGTDGQLLIADSSETTGVKWVDSPAPPQTEETVTGATNVEAVNTTISDKALVPSNLPTIFASPSAIGGTTPSAATFSTLQTTGTLTVEEPLGPASGATGISTYTKGDLLVATGTNTIQKLSVGSTNKYLMVDSSTETGLKWGTISAFNPSSGLPSGYVNLGPVSKLSKTVYTINYLYARNALGDSNVVISTPQNLDLYQKGSNVNGIYTGEALAGTITVYGRHLIGDSTSFTTSVVAGDYLNINGANVKVTSVESDTDLIIDAPSAQHDTLAMLSLVTNGSQISNEQAKFGSTSLRMNTNNRYKLTGVSDMVYHFTIEFWFYIDSLLANIELVNVLTRNIILSVTSSGTITCSGTSATATSRSQLKLNTWYHFALSSDGNKTFLFVNGQLALDLSKFEWHSENKFWNTYLTLFNNTTSTYYVDELRISNIARYTEEFTPAESVFTIDPYTINLNHFEAANGTGAASVAALDDTIVLSPYTFTVNKSFDLTNKRLYLYGISTTGYNLHYMNSIAGDDLTNVGLSSYVQLPYVVDLNVDGNVNEYGFYSTKTSSSQFNTFNVNSGNTLSASYKLRDTYNNAVSYKNQTIDLTSTFIDSGSTESLYTSTILAGTVSITGTAVTGSGTLFQTDFAVNDYIILTNTQEKFKITDISSDTALTVLASGTNTSGSYYYKQTTTSPSPTTTALTGTVDVVSGNTLIGSGTTFTSEVAVGDLLRVSNAGVSYVKSIDSDTQLVLSNNVYKSTPNVLWTPNSGILTAWDGFTTSASPVYNNQTYSNYGFLKLQSASTQFLQSASDITYNIDTNGGFTLISLVRFTSTPTGSERIFDCNNGTTVIQLQANGTNTGLTWLVNDSGSSRINFSTNNFYFTVGEWFVVGIRYTKSGLSANIYKNGVLYTSGSASSAVANRTVSAANNRIGKSSSTLYSNIDLSAFYIFDYSISDSDFTNLTNYLLNSTSYPTLQYTPLVRLDSTNVRSGYALSTTEKKFGSTSLALTSATAQVVASCITPSYLYEYTLECWAYPPAGACTILSWDTKAKGYGSSTTKTTMSLTKTAGNLLSFTETNAYASGSTSTATITSVGTVSSAWHHIAICQNQYITKVYLDGTLIDSVASNLPYSEAISQILIGSSYSSGYIDELRLSNVIRYTADFTPATEAFTKDSYTLLLKHFEGTNNQTELNDADDRIYTLTGQTATKVVHNNLSLAMSGVLSVVGKYIYGYNTSFRSEIKHGDQLYLPSLNRTTNVINVLSDNAMIVSDLLTPKSNINNVKWYACGSTYLSSKQKRFGGSSLYIGGTASPGYSYASVQGIPTSFSKSRDYTIEFWFNAVASSGNCILFGSKYSATGGLYSKCPRVQLTSAYALSMYSGLSSTTAVTVASGSWNHIAIVNIYGIGLTFYINGISAGSLTFTDEPAVFAPFILGGLESSSFPPMTGYIDEFRFSSIARYTSNFNIPTINFQNDSYTLLLNHFDGPDGSTDLSLSDESSADYSISNIVGYSVTKYENEKSATSGAGTVTVLGNVVSGSSTAFKADFIPGDSILVANKKYKIQSVKDNNSMIIANNNTYPVNTAYGTAALSATQYKFGIKSLFINGASNYLQIMNSRTLSTPYYTIELFVYPTSLAATRGILQITKYGYDNNLALIINTNGTISVILNTSSISDTKTSTATVTVDTWSHIALTYNGTYYLSVNGTVMSFTSIVQFGYGSTPIIQLGRYLTNYLVGYIDELRISSIPRYTSNFTPTTSEFTSDSHTQLLYHFNDSNIFASDSNIFPVLCSSYGAVLSTTSPKIGTASLYFEPTGTSYVTISAIPIPTSWTIEMWVSQTASSTNTNVIFCAKQSGQYAGLAVINNNGNVAMYLGSGGSWNIANNSGSTALTNNTWTHIAISYDGTSYRFCVGGTVRSTVTSSVAVSPLVWSNLVLGDPYNPYLCSGVDSFKALGTSFVGYIDELRISSNARYTGNYTPSTSAYTTDANTLVLHHFDGANNDPNIQNITLSTSGDVYYGAPNQFTSYHKQKASSKNTLYTYIASKSTDQQLVLSTSSNTPTLPSGYVSSTQLPYVVTYNIDDNLHRTVIEKKKTRFINKPLININTTNANTWYELDLSHYVPTSVSSIDLSIAPMVGNAASIYLSENSNGLNSRQINTLNTSNAILDLWLDASDSNTVSLSGNNVTAWNDKSGNSFNASVSSSGTNSPTYTTTLNGLNVITFGGNGNKCLALTSGPGTIKETVSFYVVQFSSLADSMSIIYTSGTWATYSLNILLNPSTRYWAYNVYNSSIASTTTPSTSIPYLITLVDNITSAQVYINGTQILTNTTFNGIANRNYSTINIGGWDQDTARTLNGIIGECKVYKGTMATTERNAIEAALGAKWGITVANTVNKTGDVIKAPIKNSKMYIKSDASNLSLTLHEYNTNL